MDILKFELKKLLTSKVLWFLTAVCIAVNVSVVLSHRYNFSDMEYYNGLAGEVGTEITADTVKKLEKIYEDKLASFEKSAPEAAEEYKSTGNVSIDNFVNGEVSVFVGELNRTENFIGGAVEAMGRDSKTEADDILKAKLEMTDSAVLKLLYLTENRLVVNNSSSEHLAYPGDVHTFVFGTVIPALFAEMMLLGAFIVFRSCTYELSEGTTAIVYSARRGRKLQRDKFLSSLITASVGYVFISAVTFTLFFAVYNIKEFLFTPVGSYMYGAVFSAADFTFFGLLTSCFALGLCLAGVFCAIAYALCGFIKNSFLGLGLYTVFQIICIMLGSGMCLEKITLSAALFAATPAGLIARMDIVGRKLSVMMNFFTVAADRVPFAEIYTVIVWFFICLLAIKLAERAFGRKEL